MKTLSGWFHLRGLFLLSMAVAIGSLLSISASAQPTDSRESAAARPHVAQAMPAPQQQVQIYVLTSASAIPKPISYYIGGVMTTAIPVEIIGRDGQTVIR